LIADLDADNYATRKQAEQKLIAAADDAFLYLNTSLSHSQLSLEARTRLNAIINRTRFCGATPANLRLLRLIHVLEQLSTADAIGLLKLLSQGSPNAWITREAHASLSRLAD
jgi:hypothetical protein